MRRHDHDVRTDVESMIWRVRFSGGIRHPCTDIHVGDANAFNLGCAASKAVLHPTQEYRVEAPWLIVRIPRNCRETGPFVRSSAKDPVFTATCRRPVEQC